MTPSHPVVSLLVGLSIPFSHSFIVPLAVLVFGFQTVKSKLEQEMSPRMKDGEKRGSETDCERPGAGIVEAPGEI